MLKKFNYVNEVCLVEPYPIAGKLPATVEGAGWGRILYLHVVCMETQSRLVL